MLGSLKKQCNSEKNKKNKCKPSLLLLNTSTECCSGKKIQRNWWHASLTRDILSKEEVP